MGIPIPYTRNVGNIGMATIGINREYLTDYKIDNYFNPLIQYWETQNYDYSKFKQ